MFRLLLSLALLLQVSPQIHWKSEVKQAPDGTNQLVLTGDLDPGIDHVTGTVTYMPCEGEACYLPVDWDFEQFFSAARLRKGFGKRPGTPCPEHVPLGDGSGAAAPELSGKGSASGDRSHPRLRKREGPAAEGSGRVRRSRTSPETLPFPVRRNQQRASGP